MDIIQSLSMSNMTNKNGIVYYWYFIFQTSAGAYVSSVLVLRLLVLDQQKFTLLFLNSFLICFDSCITFGNSKRFKFSEWQPWSTFRYKISVMTKPREITIVMSNLSVKHIYTMRCVRDFTVVTICWQQNNICNEIVVVKYYLKFTRLCTLFNSFLVTFITQYCILCQMVRIQMISNLVLI